MDDDETRDDPIAARLRAARPETEPLADRVCKARILGRHVSIPELASAGYLIDKLISAGTYGTVFLGRQQRLGRPVALKQLRAARADQFGSAELLKEELTLGKLNHPNVVQVIDVISTRSDGTLIAMEYVDGGSLERWQETPREWREVLENYLQAGDGLAAVHAAGILHLDFKPANVLLGTDGRVRVADFGLSRAHAVPTEGSDPGLATDPTLPPIGTRAYNSPEQRARRPVDTRSDQFSFCAALYEALSRRLPFSDGELVRMADSEQPVTFPVAARSWPRHLVSALRRGLAAKASERWPDMDALLAALRHTPWHKRPQLWGVFGAAVVAMPAAIALATDATTCGDARAQLDGVWDDQRRDEVRAAYRASEAPWSAELETTVVAGLDRHADAWVAGMTATCERAGPQAASPAIIGQLACLDRTRLRLGAVADVLRLGSRDVLERGDDLVRELDAADSCREGEGGDAGPPASSPAPEVIAEVDKARLLLSAGRVRDARDAAERAVELAKRDAAPDGRAEAHLVRGRVLDVLGQDADALQELEQGVASAIEAGRNDLAAEGWRRMTYVAAWNLQDLQRAESTLRLADAALARIGNPARSHADLLDVRGLYLSAGGDDAAAESAHRAALAELDRVLEDDDPRWAETWIKLSGVRARRGDLEEAMLLDQRALELRLARLGPEHPDVGDAYLARALLHVNAGDDEAGIADAERAQTIMEANFGAQSVRVAPALTRRAESLFLRGKLDEAEPLARRAWEVQREQLPATHTDRMYGAVNTLIAIAGARGDFAQVLELYKSRRADVLAAGDREAVAICDNGIAHSLFHLGRFTEAHELYSELAADARQSPMLRAYGLSGKAGCELRLGLPEEAREHLEVSLAELERLGDAPPDVLAETRANLAEALHRTGRDTRRATGLARSALAYYRSPDQVNKDQIERIETLLGSTSADQRGSR